jgi:hypothetical protein
MTAALLLALALFGRAPFWETKPPAQWTDAEVQELLTNSIWAQPAVDSRGGGVAVYLASARPMREAELELARRQPPAADDPGAEEYRDFLRENQGKQIVLAVALPDRKALEDPVEVRRMEEECVLKVGRKKYQMTGHFPPGKTDPYLRLVFPRAVTVADRSLVFELYVPGLPSPYRRVEFRVQDLAYRGAVEM